MHIKVEVEQLKAMAKLLKPATPRNSVHIDGVLLMSDSQKVMLTATDLEMTVSAKLEVISVEGQGEFIIPPAIIFELFPTLEGVVEIALQKSRVILTGENIDTKFPQGDPEGFPTLPKVTSDFQFTVDGGELASVLGFVRHATRGDDSQLFTQVVSIFSSGSAATCTATDGLRLASADISVSSNNGAIPAQLMIPIKHISGMLSSGLLSGQVHVSGNKDKVKLVTENASVIFTQVKTSYPDWKSIIPEGDALAMISVEAEQIAPIAQRAHIFCRENNQGMEVRATTEGITLAGSSVEEGNTEDSLVLPDLTCDDEVTLRLKSTFFQSAISALKGNINIHIYGTDLPVIIRPSENGSGKLCLIMPMKPGN